MAGEITDQSAILQTRVTSVEGLTDGYVPGTEAFVRFHYTKTSQNDEKISKWIKADSIHDFIVKFPMQNLTPNEHYQYEVELGIDTLNTKRMEGGSFKTNPGPNSTSPVSFAVVTGMNYYHFHYGKYDSSLQYVGEDKHLGFPALKSISAIEPDYFIGTGDNVYFDHPATGGYEKALEKGRNPLPGLFDGKPVFDEAGMRRKYHVQFVQPRFVDLFSKVGTYWMKDDHDHRMNDSDPYMDYPISHELGIKNFREQLPVVFPPQSASPTYRTLRMSKDVQVWFLEGRDYRSPNKMKDGPDKTIWGAEQKAWLQKTLLESTATFKFIITPTPMVGPDDAYKTDNHVNHEGFRHEGDAFFDWLTENDFLNKNLYLICGDRHWQYHAIHPSGFEEFSTGALVDANSRAGRLAGDPKSTDPNAEIKQPYVQGTDEEASGGFLLVKVSRDETDNPELVFSFYDEKGRLQYDYKKARKQ